MQICRHAVPRDLHADRRQAACDCRLKFKFAGCSSKQAGWYYIGQCPPAGKYAVEPKNYAARSVSMDCHAEKAGLRFAETFRIQSRANRNCRSQCQSDNWNSRICLSAACPANCAQLYFYLRSSKPPNFRLQELQTAKFLRNNAMPMSYEWTTML